MHVTSTACMHLYIYIYISHFPPPSSSSTTTPTPHTSLSVVSSSNRTMKLHFSSHALVFFILFVFLLLSVNTTTSARTPFLLPVDPELTVGREEMTKMDGPTQALLDRGSGVDMEGHEEAWNLMGMEQCNDGDEECLKRRLMSEAHLDYIYTQKHKP